MSYVNPDVAGLCIAVHGHLPCRPDVDAPRVSQLVASVQPLPLDLPPGVTLVNRHLHVGYLSIYP